MGRLALILSILAVCTGSAAASLAGLVGAWGRDFVVSTFEPEPMMVATAKGTSGSFKVIKMPDGRMMALVPMERLARMSFDDAMAMMK